MGINSNEDVDKLAKKATTFVIIDPHPIPAGDLFIYIKNKSLEAVVRKVDAFKVVDT